LPGAAGVLRRALLVWGWGHLALGDRRGWLLVLLQPLAIGGLLFAAWQLIDGTRWLAVFVPLVALLVFWVGQAVHAHGRATALGGATGGELQLALFLPFAFAVLTAFWLIGGRHGSPASTVEAYIDAWQANRADAAANLFAGPDFDVAGLQRFWADQSSELTTRLTQGRATYGPLSGLDPAHPFNSLRVSEEPAPVAGQATFRIEIVRTESFATTMLGLIPVAAQRTVVVQPLAQIALREEPSSAGLLPSSTWGVAAIWTEGSHIP
jgi:hypothetical protein